MDAVITYVNSEDKTWREEYKKHVKSTVEEARYRDWGTLQHVIKGIRQFMPFIEHIYLVVSTPSQITGIDVPEVTVVYHKDIIPEKYLPTFNSCTIEMFFHKIPGLAEEFIYFNDDTFVVKPVKKTDFFIDGKPVLNPHLQKCSQFDTNSIFVQQCKNSTELIRSKFVKKYPINVFIRQEHIMRPMLKSTYEGVWKTCEKEIINSLTRIRTKRNYNAYLFNNYDVMKGYYVQKELPYKYIKTSDSISSIISDITSDKFSVVCINDSGAVCKNDKDAINGAFENVITKKEPNNVKHKSLVLKEDIVEQESNNMHVALCAIAKNENLYIREWVEWYKKLGISKIFLYDNNDIDGERFDDVISDFIQQGFVEIINRRGIVKTTSNDKNGQTIQGLAYQDCFYNHYKEYDWMCFFDIDEFLEIYYKYKDLNHFLNNFNMFDGISVQWKMYGDNGQMFFNNKPLYTRFKCENNASYDRHLKMILKCKEYNKKLLFCAHGAYEIDSVNVLGNKVKNVYLDYEAHTNLPVYLNHFYSKSTDEFLQRKYNKPSAVTGINYNRNFNKDFLKKQYFEYNTTTEEKLQYFEEFSTFANTVNVYMASLYKDGHVIESIKSIIMQPEVKTLTLSANNYTDQQYNELVNSIHSDKLIVHRTNNERLSFEKLRFVNDDKSTKYVAFCDDDLVFYNGYFRKMIFECEKNDSAVSYHGGILKRLLPIEHYYVDRKTFSFNKEVSKTTKVDIIGNGVSLFKRDWITTNQWKDLYEKSPNVSMDDITVSYTLRKNGKNLYVVKHSGDEITERKDNNWTVYETYRKNDAVQTDWVNKYFITLWV